MTNLVLAWLWSFSWWSLRETTHSRVSIYRNTSSYRWLHYDESINSIYFPPPPPHTHTRTHARSDARAPRSLPTFHSFSLSRLRKLDHGKETRILLALWVYWECWLSQKHFSESVNNMRTYNHNGGDWKLTEGFIKVQSTVLLCITYTHLHNYK